MVFILDFQGCRDDITATARRPTHECSGHRSVTTTISRGNALHDTPRKIPVIDTRCAGTRVLDRAAFTRPGQARLPRLDCLERLIRLYGLPYCMDGRRSSTLATQHPRCVENSFVKPSFLLLEQISRQLYLFYLGLGIATLYLQLVAASQRRTLQNGDLRRLETAPLCRGVRYWK